MFQLSQRFPGSRLFRTLLVVASMALPVWAATPVQELDKARTLLEGGDLKPALEIVESVLKGQPDDIGARLLKGVILAQMGQLGDATRIFQSITDDRPDLPQPFNNLAAIQASQGRYDQALATLHKVLTLHPGYAIGHENLGDLHSSLAQRSYQNAANITGLSPRLRAKMDALAGFVAQPPEPPPAQSATSGESPPPVVPELARSGSSRSAAQRQSGKESEPAPKPSPPEPDISPFHAATESSRTIEPETASTPPAPTPTRVVTRGECFIIGPVNDTALRNRVRTWLRQRNARAETMKRPAQRALYFVYTPPSVSPQAAREREQELRALGIRDMARIHRGELANGISMGIYSSEANAGKRVRQLAAKGVEAKVAPRTQNRIQTWLKVSGAPELDTAPLFKRYPGLRREPDSCT
ncbi:MAG: tetratricopeptide repeat protein [Gammaproteobacteria bacterium]